MGGQVARPISIDRASKRKPKASTPVRASKGTLLRGGRKRVLMVLFVPSVERDGTTRVDQQRWIDAALELCGRLFGGATAYPRAKGVWRDDERGGALVVDEPVLIHCYMKQEGARVAAGRDRGRHRRRILRDSGLRGE